jgi:hypothetical protein
VARFVAFAPAKEEDFGGGPLRTVPDQREGFMRLLRLAVVVASLAVMLVVAASAGASTTQRYQFTSVEIGSGGPPAGISCGSATISRLGHVANQCILFNACGPNCHVRTITFDDGSTLVIHESIVAVISPGQSAAAGANAPVFLEITQTIVSGTGRFAGATGSGTGRVNTAVGSVIVASGTITLP